MPFIFMIGLLLVSFALMSLLAPKPHVENARANDLSSVTFPQATEAAPVPLILGRVRLKSPNTAWYGDFSSVPIQQKAGHTGGFLGIGGHDVFQTVGYKYYIGMDLALCLGGGVSLLTIWADQYTLWQGRVNLQENTFNINQPNLFGGEQSGGGMSGTFCFYNGDFTQPRNGYLASHVDTNITAYGGFSHIVLQHVYIGTATSLKQLNFELERHTDTLGLGALAVAQNGADINPMEALYFLMTDSWSGAGISGTLIDSQSFIDAGNQLYNEGAGISLLIDSANQVKDVMGEILRAVSGVLYQDPSTGKIKVKLIRPSDVPVMILDESNVLELKQFALQTWSQTFNQMRVKFVDRGNAYQDGFAQHSNFARVNAQGRLLNTDLSMPVIYDAGFAVGVAARELSQSSVPLYQVELSVNRTAFNVRPGDVATFNWPERGISNMRLRILKVKTGTLDKGDITINALQDSFATDTVVFATPQLTLWVPVTRAPLQISSRYVDEAPWWLRAAWVGQSVSSGGASLMGFAAPPSASSQGWWGYDSLDSFASQYLEVSNISYSVRATLVLSYNPSNPGTNLDSSGTGLKITGLSDASVLASATDGQLRAGNNLFMIDGELFNYSAFVDNGDGSYKLTGVRRGLLDTTLTAHAAGARVWFLGDPASIFPNQFPATDTLGVKFLDQTDQGVYDEGSQPSDSVVLSQRADRPLRPSYLQVNSSFSPGTINFDTCVVSWRERLRTDTSLRWEDDATQAPEAGQTYVLRVSENAGAFVEYPLSGTSYTYTFASAGSAAEFQVYSVLGGLRSRSFGDISVAFISPSLSGSTIQTRDTAFVKTRDGAVLNWR